MAAATSAAGTLGTSVARRIVRRLLASLEHGSIDVIEPDGARATFGDPTADLQATVTIRDPRAWSALVRHGSVGYGGAYADGWWETDDLAALTRIVIRNLGPLDRMRLRWADLVRVPRGALAGVLPRVSRERNRDDIAAHYDLGNDFFELFLDDTMTYSSAVFTDEDEPLESASNRKYDRLLDKLAVAAEHDVLEIGTGWGGFAARAATTRGCAVTTTTISQAQHDRVEQLVAGGVAPGVVRPLLADWRDLPGRGERFDRVVSIEMIEAVEWRDYGQFFDTIERSLRTDGMVGLQAICLPDRRFEAGKYHEDFIKRYIFPGGMLPSVGAMVDAGCRRGTLQLLDLDDLTAHYVVTLRRWRQRFDANEQRLDALGYDDRFRRLWRMYLAYCEAAFAERHCTVAQLVFVGPQWRGSPTVRVA
jgi:cyclopropane-fatty-acyl-phospholipid synthase